jgi:hypothetical protein
MSADTAAAVASRNPPATAVQNVALDGLTSNVARSRLEQDGPNATPDTSVHPLRNALAKFWAPVPWLLEASIVLQVVLHKYFEAAIIAGLLVFNAALAYLQEGHAQATLAALKSRLALNASVRRGGIWKTVPASELVRGDLVKLSLGGVVAADVHLVEGSVLLDQSMLTGESLPIEAGPGVDTFAGALVRRGEATAEVTATGVHTKFGRTAELVRTAHVVSSQQKAVLRIVRNLAIFNGVVILLIGAYAYAHAMPWNEIIALLLTSVLAAVPVALPATFTLAAALGARALAKLGVLPTRLSAVDEAATIDVLGSDKTGTLTCNQLSVTSVRPMPGFDEAHVLGMAALASSEGSQDSVDAAIRSASSQKPASDLPKLTTFVPFDPAEKTSEATATDAKGTAERIIKGAFTAVSSLTTPASNASVTAEELEKQGFRVLAVAAGPPASVQLIGLIALSDPPRTDSNSLISELHTLGVRTVMVTGDAPATAAIVAHAVGLEGAVCPPGPVPDAIEPQDFAVFASILPEGKYNLVKAFQGDVSAHSDLHAQFRSQEDRASAFVGNRFGHDWARGLDSHADGHLDDHWRLSDHVTHNGQSAALGATECLANKQGYERRRHPGRLFSGVLYCSLGSWQIRNGTRNGSAENPFGPRHRLWQPSHDLRDTRPPPPVGTAPDHMAGAVLFGRSSYHLDVGYSWDCDGATTPPSAGRRTCSGCRFRVGPRRREDPCVCSPQNFVERCISKGQSPRVSLRCPGDHPSAAFSAFKRHPRSITVRADRAPLSATQEFFR